jgi:signal transduction histidine kinase
VAVTLNPRFRAETRFARKRRGLNMVGQLSTRDLHLQSEGETTARRGTIGQIVGELSRSVTSAQVGAVLAESSTARLGAAGCAVAVLSEDRTQLHVLHANGQSRELARQLDKLRLDARHPLCDVVRGGVGLWVRSAHEFARRYPERRVEGSLGAWIVMPLSIDGIALGAIGWSFALPGATPEQHALVDEIASLGSQALYRAELFDTERTRRRTAEAALYHAEQRLALLHVLEHVSAILDSTLDAQEALASVARATLPAFGDWCLVDIADDRGMLRRISAVHVDATRERALMHRGPRRVPRALRNGQPLLVHNPTERSASVVGVAPRALRHLSSELGLSSLLATPLRFQDHTVGLMTFGTSNYRGSGIDDTDLDLAHELGRRCAAVVERANLQRMVRGAERAREEFVATTSHELRTPLSHIKGFVSTLRTTDMTWDAETRDDFLEEIEREADRLAKLVSNLLDMSRLESSGLDREAMVPTQPRSVIDGALDRVHGSLGEHPLQIDVAEDLPPVRADAAQIESVVANLLENAAKYSPPDEPIAISARAEGSIVRVRVEDRGLGVPPEHAERIFEPFFREPALGYPVKPGTGLGLAICRGIVQAHGGRIWVEQRPGGGASFVFSLPVAL